MLSSRWTFVPFLRQVKVKTPSRKRSKELRNNKRSRSSITEVWNMQVNQNRNGQLVATRQDVIFSFALMTKSAMWVERDRQREREREREREHDTCSTRGQLTLLEHRRVFLWPCTYQNVRCPQGIYKTWELLRGDRSAAFGHDGGCMPQIRANKFQYPEKLPQLPNVCPHES